MSGLIQDFGTDFLQSQKPDFRYNPCVYTSRIKKLKKHFGLNSQEPTIFHCHEVPNCIVAVQNEDKHIGLWGNY